MQEAVRGLVVTDPHFVVQTCEARAKDERQIPFVASAGKPSTPFEASDPFGLRKAIFPIFERSPSGYLTGLGTAFHVDGWGGCLTAEHVVEFLRVGLPDEGLTGEKIYEIDPSRRSHAVALLGIGLVYGKIVAPGWAYAPIVDVRLAGRERDDPLAALQGRGQMEVASDVASLQVAISPCVYAEHDPPQALPLDVARWTSTIGERVLAFGYPELRPKAGVSGDEFRLLIEDGLFAAYGTITRVFPRGRDRANPTPAFEVSANWPSGMSGGPVVNEAGNVVGLVSRSLAPEDGTNGGVGYAACLPWIAELGQLLPFIDRQNIGFRRGYAVYDDERQRLVGAWPTKALAEMQAAEMSTSCTVFACVHRIGTDEWVRTVAIRDPR